MRSQPRLTKKEARLAALHLKRQGLVFCQQCSKHQPTIDNGATCAVCKLVLP